MKLAYIHTSLYETPKDGSGCGSHNQFMQRAFRKLGHNVVVLQPARCVGGNTAKVLRSSRSLYGKLKSVMPRWGTDWLRDVYSIVFDVFYIRSLMRTIKAERPEFVYERYSDYHVSGGHAARRCKLPYVLEVHAPPEARAFTQRCNFDSLNRAAQRRLCRNADKVVVVSNYMKRVLMNDGIPAERIMMLPNAVDLEFFCARNRRSEVRARYGFRNEVVVGFVGTMQPYHGHGLLPDVCRRLLEKRTDIRFLIVGSFARHPGGQDAYWNSLRLQGMERYFVLSGGVPVEEVPSHIEAMDICLMPDSNPYGSPIKLFEYGALSKPCVFPRYPAIEDVMSDGRNGLLFQPGDVDGMAQCILRLAECSVLSQALGRELHRNVSARHTWCYNATRILEMIGPIVERKVV